MFRIILGVVYGSFSGKSTVENIIENQIYGNNTTTYLNERIFFDTICVTVNI